MVQLMPLHPKTPSSLASFKSKLVLPFWYWLTQVVLKKTHIHARLMALFWDYLSEPVPERKNQSGFYWRKRQ